MAGAECAKLVRGKVARVTKIDECGSVLPGPLNMVVTEGTISVAYTMNNDAGTTITVANAAGENLVNNVPKPKFQSITGVMTFIEANPILLRMMTNQETWDGIVEGTITGFTIGTDTEADETGFALELWSGLEGRVCADGLRKWGWFLVPWFQAGTVGNITWANDAISFTIENFISQEPNDWGVGPWNVTLDETDQEAPLRVPLGEWKHLLFDLVRLAPPVADCGGQPVGTAPTGATAGIPGTYTPSGSWNALDLADLSDVTASPLTAWTTGQYVPLANGSKAHWNGTNWVAGPA